MPLKHHSADALSPSVTRHILVILVIAVFITTMALIILQNTLGSGAPRVLKSYNQGYADGFRAARAQFASAVPGVALERPSLSGTVLSFSQRDGLTFQVFGMLSDTPSDGMGAVRTALVTEQTQVIVRTERSPEEIAAAQAAFVRSRPSGPLAEGATPPPPPATTTETPGTLADIAVGDKVQVTGENGEDLTLRDSFTATVVVVSKAYRPEE